MKEIKSERIQMMVTPGELEAIDDWRFANRIGTRSEATRELVIAGLRYSEEVRPYADALRMIHEAVGEMFGPVATLESEETTLLRGAEPHHRADAIVEALGRVKLHVHFLELAKAAKSK